ncbi:MAG: hypothetical protein KC586_22795, partial [Myxococcales bacterium]|nr:hypothetical protein [Myxococcales bacterium]
MDGTLRALADDSNWATRTSLLRELAGTSASWPDAVSAAVIALLDRRLEGTPETVHSIEMSQRGAVDALVERAPFDERATSALVRRARRGDRVSTSAFAALTKLAKQDMVHAHAAAAAMHVLRADDRARSNAVGGEGPLAPLWTSALELLAHVAPPNEDVSAILVDVLARAEIAFETNPMYRSTETVRSAALGVVAARFGTETPEVLRARVRALVDGVDDRLEGSAVPPTSELLRTRAAVVLARIATSDEERRAAVERVRFVAAQRWTGVVLDVIPSLRAFTKAERNELASVIATDSRCLPALVEALGDELPRAVI